MEAPVLLHKQNAVSIPDESANMSSLWSCMITQVYVLSDLTLNLGDLKKISDSDHQSLDEKIIIYFENHYSSLCFLLYVPIYIVAVAYVSCVAREWLKVPPPC